MRGYSIAGLTAMILLAAAAATPAKAQELRGTAEYCRDFARQSSRHFYDKCGQMAPTNLDYVYPKRYSFCMTSPETAVVADSAAQKTMTCRELFDRDAGR